MVKLVSCCLIVIFSGVCVRGDDPVLTNTYTNRDIKVVGHRGTALFAPENTLASFTACREIADMVEFDVRVSLDGTLVVMHDSSVNRTTDGSGYVASLTSGQLELLDAGSWFSSVYAGERIPTMEEAVVTILPYATPLIEHKAGTASEYVTALEFLGVTTNVVLQSFDHAFLAQVHSLNPDIPLTALGSGTLSTNKLDDLKSQGVSTVAWRYYDITPEIIEEVHNRGMEVFVWTVNGTLIQTYMELGVDGIISDDPRMVCDICNYSLPIDSVMSDELVSYWMLDDGQVDSVSTNAVDVEDLNNGALIGFDEQSFWVPDSPFSRGGSLSFDGTDDYVAIRQGGSLDIGTNEVSLSAWIRMNREIPDMLYSYGSIYDSSEDSYVLYQDKGNSQLRFKVTDEYGDLAYTGISYSSLTTSIWHYVVAVFDGNAGPVAGQVKIYLDGKLMDVYTGRYDSGGRGLVGSVKPGQIAMMGRNGLADNGWFEGCIDDVAVWRRALLTSEIRQIYNSGLQGHRLQSLVLKLSLSDIRVDCSSGNVSLDVQTDHGSVMSNDFFVTVSSDIRGPYTNVECRQVLKQPEGNRIIVAKPSSRSSFF